MIVSAVIAWLRSKNRGQPVGDSPPAAGSLGGRRDDLAVDLQAHDAIADPDRHEEPSPAPGSHWRAVREPAAGRKPGKPGAHDAWSRNPGSQLREPLPSDCPGLSATPRGESAGGGSPPDFLRPAQTPVRAWGSRGRRFKSGRPDHCLAGQRPLRRVREVASRSFDRTLTAGFGGILRCTIPVDAGHLSSGSWATVCGRGSGRWAAFCGT